MITCDRKELFGAVQLISGIIPSKTPKPVLENALFRASKNEVEVLATDLEVGVKVTLKEVEVQQEGEFLVPGHKLLGILRESDADKITFAMEDNSCKISSGDDHYKVLSLSPNEFPQLAIFPEKETFSLSGAKLREMVKKTHFAAATEATRYAMNSVLLDINDQYIKMIATDGKRLAYIQTPSPFKGEFFLLLPTKGILQMDKTLSNVEEDVRVFIKDNQFLLEAGSITLTIRLLQGTYPPYENVIPKDFPLSVKMERDQLFKSLKRAALLTTQDSKSVRFCFETNKLTLFSNDPNVGEAKIPVPTECEIEEKLEISYNPILVMEVLKVLDNPNLALELKDSTSPGIIREGDEYLYVVMPLNI